jgi:hypothetical protein
LEGIARTYDAGLFLILYTNCPRLTKKREKNLETGLIAIGASSSLVVGKERGQ